MRAAAKLAIMFVVGYSGRIKFNVSLSGGSFIAPSRSDAQHTVDVCPAKIKQNQCWKWFACDLHLVLAKAYSKYRTFHYTNTRTERHTSTHTHARMESAHMNMRWALSWKLRTSNHARAEGALQHVEPTYTEKNHQANISAFVAFSLKSCCS